MITVRPVRSTFPKTDSGWRPRRKVSTGPRRETVRWKETLNPLQCYKINQKRRRAPGPLGDFCQQVADLSYYLFLLLSLFFPLLFITSRFSEFLVFSFLFLLLFPLSFVFLGFSFPKKFTKKFSSPSILHEIPFICYSIPSGG